MPYKLDCDMNLMPCSDKEFAIFKEIEYVHLLTKNAPIFTIEDYAKCTIIFDGSTSDKLFYVAMIFDHQKDKAAYSKNYITFLEAYQMWSKIINIIQNVRNRELNIHNPLEFIF